MNILKRFVTGLGNQTAPFGFAPDDPNAAYKAGLGYIGDVGANLLANNQGGVDGFANLGASLQQAKTQGIERNRQQFTAQQLMEEAALRKQKREEEAAAREQRNQWLKSISDPNMRATLEANPSLIDDYVLRTNPAFQKPDQPNLTADMQNFLFAQENPEFASYLQQGQGGGGDGKWGATVVPLRNKETGELVAGQFNQGQGGIFINGEQADPNVWEYAPGELASVKSAGSKEGGIVGEARGALPGAIAQAEKTSLKIDRLLNDPDTKEAIGYTSWLPDAMAPSKVIRIRAMVDELMGDAFLEARNMLKGGGQITDYEGKRAEAAYARMERAIKASDPEVFDEALRDFKQAVADGVEKLRKTARVPDGGGDGWTDVGNGVRIREKGK